MSCFGSDSGQIGTFPCAAAAVGLEIRIYLLFHIFTSAFHLTIMCQRESTMRASPIQKWLVPTHEFGPSITIMSSKPVINRRKNAKDRHSVTQLFLPIE